METMASLTTIEGIGKRHAKQLRKAGIRGTVTLLNAGCTKKGRKQLAADTTISEKLILAWCNKADLMRVKGVGEEYSDLLEASGVDTVKELRKRKPANLHAKMLEVNSSRKVGLVRRPPALSEVEGWVEAAGALDPMMTY
jgi:predicted flap endonuclease-1-like 5' DNA nuclease